jgi:hypothetical protein
VKNKQDEEYVDFAFRTRWFIDLEDYFAHPAVPWNHYEHIPRDIVTSYAYGMLINTFHTKIFVLDYDGTDATVIEKTALAFMAKPEVVAVDIVKSSKENYHLIVGFDDFFDVRNLYSISFYGACSSFLQIAKSLNEVTIRVSDKKKRINNYFSAARDTTPAYNMCLRKIDGDWFSFTNHDISYPRIKLSEASTRKTKLKDKIDLRRKRGDNSSKPKSEGTKAPAISSLKDIEALSAADRERCEEPDNGDDWF